MKPLLKFFTLSLVIVIAFTFTVSTAQAQELTISGTTRESSFNGGSKTLGGLAFFGNDFGGKTSGGELLFVQNNNLGTITFDPNVQSVDGGFKFVARLFAPGGLEGQPIEVLGFALGSGYTDANNFALIDFDNDAKVVALNDGSVFYLTLYDVCLSEGQPCFIEPDECRFCEEIQTNNPTKTLAVNRENVRELRFRSRSGNSATKVPVDAPSNDASKTVTIAITGSISTLANASNTCTRGQGYYKNTFSAIPRDFNDFDGFNAAGVFVRFGNPADPTFKPFTPNNRIALGNRFYDREELLAIYRTPVKKNGLISLAHQLITAKLNANRAGFPVPVVVSNAISEADGLIGDLIVPPTIVSTGPPTIVSSDSLSTSRTPRLSFLINTLSDYNEGRSGVQSCR